MLKYISIFNRILLVLLLDLCFLNSQGVLKQDDQLLKSDVVTRLTSLRQFIPQKHYKWYIHWIDEGIYKQGTLEGLQQDQMHWITIKFSPGNSLSFDKSNPCIALCPNKLCLCKPETFTSPLPGLPGMCIHMIAMSFLDWNIVSCTKAAKLGRRAIQVLLVKDNLYCEIFLDKNFNTILQAKMWDTQNKFHTSFTLKRFKKFKTGWSIRTAEFTLNSHKTSLYVDDIIAWD